MRALGPALRRVTVIICALLVMPGVIMAQDAGDPDEQAYSFSKEELTQMLAPIALYPDALTAQVLIASTYPLEVVEADRWMSQNRQLKGKDLDSALQDKNWDPSIKSLCHFPDILKSMSDKLDQTRKLGDAFLGQEEEVMATIQELRGKARDHGTLKTTDEQKVLDEGGNIIIEPANPEVVYVPVYDPAYVYGPWWYPDYPPYYWYYPPGLYSGVYFGFGPGIYFGYTAFSWVWFDWSFHRVHFDINRTRSFHHFRGRQQDIGRVWTHNPSHRRGVAYRDLRTSERFGGRPPRASSPAITERRGYPGGRPDQYTVRPPTAPPQRGDRPAVQQSTPGVRQAPATGGQAPEIRRDGAPAPRAQSGSAIPPRPVVRDTPFRGIGEGGFERRAGERGGISSQGTTTIRQPTGGFSGSQMQQRQGGGSISGGGSRGGGGGGGVSGGGSRGGGSRR